MKGSFSGFNTAEKEVNRYFRFLAYRNYCCIVVACGIKSIKNFNMAINNNFLPGICFDFLTISLNVVEI